MSFQRTLSPLAAIVFMLIADHVVWADDSAKALPLLNPSFEDGLNGWHLQASNPTVAQVLPEAASMGAKGLRVQSMPDCMTFSLTSTPIPIEVGKTYSVTYWFGGGGDKPGGGVNVEMVFKGPDGTELKAGLADIRKWFTAGVSGDRFFNSFQLAASAPDGATTLTIAIKSASPKPCGAVDLDDFQVAELPPRPPPPPPPPLPPGATPVGIYHPVPPTDPAVITAMLKEIQDNPYRGKTAPKIVLKLDDLRPTKKDGVHEKWQKVDDYIKAKGIKASFGIIADGMEVDCPKFCQWVKDENAVGVIEFWCHGYDHKGDGKVYEFYGQPYEYQKEHLDKCEQLAKDKLGFPFVSFGAPFNATDANTEKALEEEPDIKVWMYGDPKLPADKVVLERCGVNLENPTLIANYGAFLINYAHNRGAEFFVMQGHPAGWDDNRFAQFTMIVDFLMSQKATFVHPRDFAVGATAPMPAAGLPSAAH